MQLSGIEAVLQGRLSEFWETLIFLEALPFYEYAIARAMYTIVALLFGLAIYERIWLASMKTNIPGPSWTLPFLGKIYKMIVHPFKFYEDQEAYGPFSWTTFFGQFVIFSKDSDLTKKVFQSSKELQLWLTIGAKRILGERNIAFLNGTEHKQLRKQLLPLFTKKALSIYLSIQEKCIRKHLALWNESRKEQGEMKSPCRDLNMETSTSVFVGTYLEDKDYENYRNNYFMMNEGFITVPINFPGTALNKAIKARHRVVDLLKTCVVKSKKRMALGEEPECLLDVWMEDILPKNEERLANGEDPLPHTSDQEIAEVVLDFLFASQDASTSSLVWTIDLLHKHKDILEKVRAEQKRLRPTNSEPITYDLVSEMEYTRMVMKELLRFRPPATMVPHRASQDVEIDGYKIKKGAVVLPSIWCSHHAGGGFKNPEKFDPQRFDRNNLDAVKDSKYYIPFGIGPHMCLGKDYAMYNLTLFLALLSTSSNWERIPTEDMDEIIFLPTIYPKDCCIAKFSPREATA